MSSASRSDCSFRCFLPAFQNLCLSSVKPLKTCHLIRFRACSQNSLLLFFICLYYSVLLLINCFIQRLILIIDCLRSWSVFTVTLVSVLRVVGYLQVLHDCIGVASWPAHFWRGWVWQIIEVLTPRWLVNRSALMTMRRIETWLIQPIHSHALFWDVGLEIHSFLKREFRCHSQSSGLNISSLRGVTLFTY